MMKSFAKLFEIKRVTGLTGHFKLNKGWEKACNSFMFAVSYVACLLTPFVIGIIQSSSFSVNTGEVNNYTLTYVLFLTDILFLIDFYYSVKDYYGRTQKFGKHKNGSNKRRKRIRQQIPILVIEGASCTCALALPLAEAAGVAPSTLVWISVLRMARILKIPSYYHSSTRATTHHADITNTNSTPNIGTIANAGAKEGTEEAEASQTDISGTASRLVVLSLFASLYGSAMSCIWFRLGCTRVVGDFSGNNGTNDDGGVPLEQFEQYCESGASTSTVDSWVRRDSVIDISDPWVCFLRSVHFTMQVRTSLALLSLTKFYGSGWGWDIALRLCV